MMHFNTLVDYNSTRGAREEREREMKEEGEKREHTDVICQQIQMFIKNRQQQGVNVLNRKEKISSKEQSVSGDEVGLL